MTRTRAKTTALALAAALFASGARASEWRMTRTSDWQAPPAALKTLEEAEAVRGRDPRAATSRASEALERVQKSGLPAHPGIARLVTLLEEIASDLEPGLDAQDRALKHETLMSFEAEFERRFLDRLDRRAKEATRALENARIQWEAYEKAQSLLDTGRIDRAEPLLVALLEFITNTPPGRLRTFRADGPGRARVIEKLIEIYWRSWRLEEARSIEAGLPADRRPSRARSEASDSPAWRETPVYLGEVSAFLLRILDVFAPSTPQAMDMLHELARDHQRVGRDAIALDHARRATSAARRGLLALAQWRGELSLVAEDARERTREPLQLHAQLALRVAGLSASPRREALQEEAFELAQLARRSDAALAIARLASRYAVRGDLELAALVRRRRELAVERLRVERASRIRMASRPRVDADHGDWAGDFYDDLEERVKRALETGGMAFLDVQLAEIDTRLARHDLTFQERVLPQPVSFAELRVLLRGDEALLVYVVSDESSHLWVVRADRVQLIPLSIGRAELEASVARLRQGLDLSLGTPHSLLFDTVAAHALYRAVLAPALAGLEGVSRLAIVPDGALESLPFGVLVTEAPARSPRTFGDFRETFWVIRRFAVATHPSAGSFAALREKLGAVRPPPSPFAGFGDPALTAPEGPVRSDLLRGLLDARLANPDSLRRLPRLPETAEELRALAQTLGAGEEALFLGPRATERMVKASDLSKVRVLAFATHGLMAREDTGVDGARDAGEPALVLTPPARATFEDDGLLTAAEVAELHLDADWVVLSACNTASGEHLEGQALSGLARAFFYAGSRALLVSHWPVASMAAVRLSTRTMEEYASHPERGRAGALQRAMLALLGDESSNLLAHPSIWGPFVLVGDDARREISPLPMQALIAPVAETPSLDVFHRVRIGTVNNCRLSVSAVGVLRRRYADLLGTHSTSRMEVELGTSGTWWNVLAGTFATRAEARGLCAALRTAGHASCGVETYEDPAPAWARQGVPLAADEVPRFLAAWEEVRLSVGASRRSFSDALGELPSGEVRGLAAMLGRYGFESLDRFAHVGDRVIRAWRALTVTRSVAYYDPHGHWTDPYCRPESEFDGAEARRKVAEAIEQIKQAMEESPVDYEQARAEMLADLEQAMEASRGDLGRQAQQDRKAAARQIRQAVDAQLRDFERQQKEVLPDVLKRSQEFFQAFGESIVRVREDSVAPELDKERVAPFLSRIETLYREN